MTIKEKNDIIIPNYIRKKIDSNYNSQQDEVNINKAINKMPYTLRKQLNETEFEIITEGSTDKDFSRYDRKNNKFYIYEGADEQEIIHEIGHYIETKYNILNDEKYISIRNKGLENYWVNAVKELPHYQGTIGITSNKFISEQQGRIYKKDLQGKSYVANYGKINLNCLGEYFAEGFREYYNDMSNLKVKDIELFKYIEELLKNAK